MKSMTLPVLLGSLLLLGAGSALAGPVVTVKVPFSFAVGDQVLPAGEYRVEQDVSNPDVLIIRSAHAGHVAMITRSVEAAGEDPAGEQSALVFTRDGEAYRLKDVWEDREDGRELPR